MRKCFVMSGALLLIGSTVFSQVVWSQGLQASRYQMNTALDFRTRQAQMLIDVSYGRMEMVQQAVAMLGEVLAEDELFAPAYIEHARAVLASNPGGGNQQQVMSATLAFIDEAIRIDPDYADAYVLLGHVRRSLGQYEDASAALERASDVRCCSDAGRAKALAARRDRVRVSRWRFMISVLLSGAGKWVRSQCYAA